jgi:transketolase
MDSTTQAQAGSTLDLQQKTILSKIANTIRGLTMDAVQKADSGHPGLPMGCAELGAYLYAIALRQNPADPKWINRDRFILSAGHGSMLLYSCLHLAGYPLSMDDIKAFRQLHSKTPGHPESVDTTFIETTSGPLGQGMGNAVGQALGLKILGQKFNTPKAALFSNKVFVLASDGDIMEGVTSEVSALAGHLKINNLIVFYDSNNICLDGKLIEASSENTKERYKSYGWDVYEIDGYDFDAMHEVVTKLRRKQDRPAFIITHTIIGKGSPNKADSNKSHGSPLGEEEVKATKEALGIPLTPFYVPQGVYDYFAEKRNEQKEMEQEWQRMFDNWAKDFPQQFQVFETMLHHTLPHDLEQQIKSVAISSPIAGRSASNKVLQKLADILPDLYGGSADLSGSDKTMMDKFPLIEPGKFAGRNIKFGVREFGMATMATGLAETGMIRPFIGTFLTFSDYMRNAIRLASLMKLRVIYHFTHDSIFLGEDGPTHQPIEHYAALRAIPNLQFIRPADANEVKMSWVAALRYAGPTAFSLSRQNLPTLTETDRPYSEGVGRGAYILKKEKSKADYMLVATGSEVHLALDVAQELERMGKQVRVISFPCWEIFEKQDHEYKESVFGGDLGQRVSIEAGVDLGWHKYIGRDGITIAMETFGASAPDKVLAEEFGFTVNSILERIL